MGGIVVGAGVWEAVDGMVGVLEVSVIVIIYNISCGDASPKIQRLGEGIAGSRPLESRPPTSNFPARIRIERASGIGYSTDWNKTYTYGAVHVIFL